MTEQSETTHHEQEDRSEGIATPAPIRRTRWFVQRGEFAAGSISASEVDLVAFRADQDVVIDQESADPFLR